jgi:hypothetical protein
MDVEQRVNAQGDDSWEAEMTWRGTTFKVEATLETRDGQPMWWLEVLKAQRWTMTPVHHGHYPTLETAIQGAKDAIQQQRHGKTQTP